MLGAAAVILTGVVLITSGPGGGRDQGGSVMNARRRYCVVVGDPAEQVRIECSARLLGKPMSGFFKTAALAHLDLVEKGLLRGCRVSASCRQ